jgi:hypothetical protein
MGLMIHKNGLDGPSEPGAHVWVVAGHVHLDADDLMLLRVDGVVSLDNAALHAVQIVCSRCEREFSRQEDQLECSPPVAYLRRTGEPIYARDN